jgi:hypothetical protein
MTISNKCICGNGPECINIYENIYSTTPDGLNGHGISYSDETEVARVLKEMIPKEYTIHFNWVQFMAFADVQYEIDFEKNIVKIWYNQNLNVWEGAICREITEKILKYEAKKQTATNSK